METEWWTSLQAAPDDDQRIIVRQLENRLRGTFRAAFAAWDGRIATELRADRKAMSASRVAWAPGRRISWPHKTIRHRTEENVVLLDLRPNHRTPGGGDLPHLPGELLTLLARDWPIDSPIMSGELLPTERTAMTVETDERAGSVVLRETVRYPSLLTDHRPTERSRYVRFDRAAGWRPVEVEVRDEPQWKRAELEWAACKDGVWRPTKVTITHGYRNEQYVAAQNPDGRSLVIGYLIDPASWTHKADEMEAALSFTRPEGVRVTAIGPAPNMMIQDYKGEL